MVEQARLAVFKAVAGATSFNEISSQSPVSTIPQFHAALNLSKSSPKNLGTKVTIAAQTNITPRPPPLPSTRTNEALTNPSQIPSSSSSSTTNTNTNTATINRAPSLTISKTRKNRSVTWDHQLDHGNRGNNNIKRRKFSEPATLKSSRSFGKPDASFFETNRNATFAEFGRPPMHLFVNGKLSTPNNNMRSMANIRAMKSVGNFSTAMGNGSSKGNDAFSAASLSLSQRLQQRDDHQHNLTTATSASSVLRNKPNNKPALFSFDSDKRKKHKPSSTIATNTNTTSNSTQSDNNAVHVNNQMHVPQPSLPRTPTALEGFLLAKTAATNSNMIQNSNSANNITSKKRSLPPEFNE